MTKQEFINANSEWFKESFGVSMSIRMKFLKHLSTGNCRKLSNYLILCRIKYPVFTDCPVDNVLIKRTIELLKSRGFVLDLSGEHDDDVTKYCVPPVVVVDDADYGLA